MASGLSIELMTISLWLATGDEPRSRHGRPVLDPRPGALEGRRRGDHRLLVSLAPHDVESDGHPVRREPAGYAGGGMADCVYRVGEREEAEVPIGEVAPAGDPRRELTHG